MDTTDNVTVVLHSFLNLPNLEKLQMVEAINEYFDSNSKETIREENSVKYERIKTEAADSECECCGR